MDKEKYINSIRNTMDDTLDDSFDCFLPTKLKEKSLSQPSVKSHIVSNTSKRKKMSPTSTASSSFQETFDSDMDNVMAICLSKDDFNSFSKISNVRKKEGKSWKEITSRMKGQPLLKTRTAADREAILSQKIAVLLVDNNELLDDKPFASISLDELILSEVLLQQCCKKCRLWSAAQQPPSMNKEFYIKAFSNYIDLAEETSEQEHCSNEQSIRLTFDLETSAELNITKESDVKKLPLPNEHSDTQLQQLEDDHSILDIFDYSQVKESEENVHSPGKISDGEMDIHGTDDHQINDSCKVENLSYDPGGAAKVDVITIASSSPSSESTIHLPVELVSNDSQKTPSPCNSISTSLTEEKEKNINMLDRIGVTLLAEQWDNLFNANEGDVIVVLDREEVLNVHRLVLSLRCPALKLEINDDNKLLWNMYSLQVAKAFFRYVYTGKCDHFWQLTVLDKTTLKLLARLYELPHLEEVLIKFHDFYDKPKTRVLNCFQETASKIKFCNDLSPYEEKESFKCNLIKEPSPTCSTMFQINSPGISESAHQASPELEESSHKEKNCTVKDSVESLEMDLNNYDYIFRSPSPSPACKEISSWKDTSHRSVKKSLEAYFQDSFPELPSDISNTTTTYPTPTDTNITDQNSEDNDGTLLSRSQQKASFNEDNIFRPSSSISSECSNNSPTNLLTNHLSSPSTSTLNIPGKSILLQQTPNANNSDVFFSKNATPFPNYDNMITPQLKNELKRYGLKGNLGSTKAKLLLKYIYEQTHPIVQSSLESEKEEAPLTQTQSSSNSEKNTSLTALVSAMVKSNKDLYTHILLFKPIWLEHFHKLLKDHGIDCSLDQLRDTLNDLCITYRSKSTRITSTKKNSKKSRPSSSVSRGSTNL